MKKILLSISMIVLTFLCFGQSNFEKGYFINNENIQIEGLIRNEDWLKNPTSFQFKMDENSTVQVQTIQEIKEFGIYNTCKYVRANVDMDMSPTTLKDLSNDKNPIWESKQLFLNALVEGSANLYYYSSGGMQRFFYSRKDSTIKQLIYKKYVQDFNQTAVNDTFRIQLQNDVSCSLASNAVISTLPYQKKELVDYFIDYNTCVDPTYVAPVRTQNKGQLNIAVSAGLAYSSMQLTLNGRSYMNRDFGSNTNGTYAIDVEYILPFNNNKWGITLSPSYQSFKSEQQSEYSIGNVDFKAIEVGVGVKRYFFLNDEAKMFVNLQYNSILSYRFDSKFGFKSHSTQDFLYDSIDKAYNPTLVYGLGFEYRRMFAEFRYHSPQNIMSKYPSWDAKLEKISFRVGYKFVQTKL